MSDPLCFQFTRSRFAASALIAALTRPLRLTWHLRAVRLLPDFLTTGGRFAAGFAYGNRLFGLGFRGTYGLCHDGAPRQVESRS